jgi:hypothetical protein
MPYNPLHFDNIELLGNRCNSCVGQVREECSNTLNAIVALQEIILDEIAKGNESFTNDDPNNEWPKFNLKSMGCTKTELEIDEMIAEVSHDEDARNYFRGVGEIGIGLDT